MLGIQKFLNTVTHFITNEFRSNPSLGLAFGNIFFFNIDDSNVNAACGSINVNKLVRQDFTVTRITARVSVNTLTGNAVITIMRNCLATAAQLTIGPGATGIISIALNVAIAGNAEIEGRLDTTPSLAGAITLEEITTSYLGPIA